MTRDIEILCACGFTCLIPRPREFHRPPVCPKGGQVAEQVKTKRGQMRVGAKHPWRAALFPKHEN